MRIEVLGHGGAFDECSTSFLLDGHILLDCGYDIVKKLLASGQLKDIDTVYITHTHQDHVSGFELLVYYSRFISHRKLTVFGSDAFWRYFDACACTTKKDRELLLKADFYKIVKPVNNIVLFDQPTITAFPVEHAGLEAYGFVVRSTSEKYVVFSGDTDGPLTLAWKDPHLAYVFHDAGWTHVPTDEFKVHPRDTEVVEACGDPSKLVLVHTCKDTVIGITHAITGDIFEL